MNKVSITGTANASVSRTPDLAPICQENIRKAVSELHALPNIFARIVQDAVDQDLPTATLVVGLCPDRSDVLPNQYVAQIHLVVYRMPDDKKLGENFALPGQPID
jgi:hypothetical protein